jgi:protein-tyrosine-phosphatase
MAEVLLRERLGAVGVDASVSSAGELPGGVHASPGSVKAMARRGIDLREHRSRTVTREHLEAADLVLAMGRRHLRNAVATCPDAFGRSFTLKELVRLGAAIGPRRPDQPLGDWLAAVHVGRTRTALLGEDPRDDVEDPIGGPDHLYESTAVELGDLIDRLVELAFASAGASHRETA